jgi:CBS domain containing-hemolysin-like protein
MIEFRFFDFFVIALLAALLCVVANGFFVAVEFAYAKVRPTALESLAKKGDIKARKAFALAQRLDGLLSATQLGITLASLALGWLGEPAIARLIAPPLRALRFEEPTIHAVSLVVGFLTITILHIVFGELLPKSIAIRFPLETARAGARSIRAFWLVMYPALVVLEGVSQALLRMFGVQERESGDALSADELRILIQASVSQSQLSQTKRELIERVLRTTDRPVRTIMVPRVDMATLSLADSLEETLRKVRRLGFSRYPVSEQRDPDKIVGYVYVKDLLMESTKPATGIRELMRDVLFVPETRTVSELLADFQKTKTPIAVIVDEYGGTSGLVTLEDVLEEFVGEIQDELDLEPQRISIQHDGVILVDGSVVIDELNIEGLDEATDAHAETMSAYVIGKLGRLARRGDEVQLGSYVIRVEEVRRRRVARASLRLRRSDVTSP